MQLLPPTGLVLQLPFLPAGLGLQLPSLWPACFESSFILLGQDCNFFLSSPSMLVGWFSDFSLPALRSQEWTCLYLLLGVDFPGLPQLTTKLKGHIATQDRTLSGTGGCHRPPRSESRTMHHATDRGSTLGVYRNKVDLEVFITKQVWDNNS